MDDSASNAPAIDWPLISEAAKWLLESIDALADDRQHGDDASESMCLLAIGRLRTFMAPGRHNGSTAIVSITEGTPGARANGLPEGWRKLCRIVDQFFAADFGGGRNDAKFLSPNGTGTTKTMESAVVQDWFIAQRAGVEYAVRKLDDALSCERKPEGAPADGLLVPWEKLQDSERHVYSVLKAAAHRMTTTAVLRAIDASNEPLGESTVKNALSNLVRFGWLDNNPRAKPPGYGALRG